jgi:hypothetical protein
MRQITAYTPLAPAAKAGQFGALFVSLLMMLALSF